MRKFRDATNPKQVKNTEEIIGALAKWEGDLQELLKTEKVVLPAMVKMAAMTEICTDEIRDMIFQNVDSAGDNTEAAYLKMRDNIISFLG